MTAKNYHSFLLSLLLSFFISVSLSFSQDGQNISFNPEDFPSYPDNEFCLRCHGSAFYVLYDSISGQEKRRSMCENYKLSRDKFYNGVHKSFACTDCHSYEYQEFPHALSLRFEPVFGCIDCHGGDENFAKYHFEEIEADYSQSVHAKLPNNEFNCWKCHDPHSYVPLARRDTLTMDFVVSSNNMCLKCHGNIAQFQLLSDRDLSNVIGKHDWLPNQSLHFKSVRCIECHSAQNNNILISHNILPKDSAVNDCVKCHSSNSLLMGTLYKFRTIQSRKSSGFVNSVIIENDSYVVGANNSRFMNITGIAILILTISVIVVHTVFRIIKSKS
jgi:hypothetical protein